MSSPLPTRNLDARPSPAAATEAGAARPAVEPFADFAPPIRPQSARRARISAATRRPEPECLPELLQDASLGPEAAAARRTALRLVTALRSKGRVSGVEGLVQ